ncbi:MAG TPA: flagellar basal body L-ring protein FlgH [Thermovirgaceae bacterium]|nr:flagellar basal body L-ring protein FlgH [Synergistales bacterium]HRV71508.1 flagellar basal body L-ring protein FlgH [Thermovirgaceae bacterium]
MRIVKILFLMVAATLVFSAPAIAESLWAEGSSLFQDHRPDKVGDIVTVVVSEKTTAKDSAKTDLTKKNDTTLADGFGLLDFIKKLGFSSSSEMSGGGTRDRSHSFNATITCIVTEVLPNGNIVLEGTKEIRVQKENMSMKITGIARPQDVKAGNILESDRLADVSVNVRGIGSISDVQQPGFLTRLLNIIF